MQKSIKQVAQFLFDNAEFIDEQLDKGDSYKSLSVYFDYHKPGGKKRVALQVYCGGISKVYYLKEKFFTLKEFELLCDQMNKDTGLQPPPIQPPVRETL